MMTAAQLKNQLADRYGFVDNFIPIEHWQPGVPFIWRRRVHAIHMDDDGGADGETFVEHLLTYEVVRGPEDDVDDIHILWDTVLGLTGGYDIVGEETWYGEDD